MKILREIRAASKFLCKILLHKNNARQQKSQIEIEACKFVNHNQHTHSKFLNRECLGADRENISGFYCYSIQIVAQ